MLLKEVEIPQKLGKLLKCNHCTYPWTYGGTREFFTSCPKCHGSVATTHAKKQTKEAKEK